MKKTKILAFILIMMLMASPAMLWSCGDEISFQFDITDSSGATTTHSYSGMDGKTVGDALIEIGLITPDSKDIGFFDTLNGVKADFSVDGSFWGFYINGEMYMDGGVFDVTIEKDALYSFRYEIWE